MIRKRRSYSDDAWDAAAEGWVDFVRTGKDYWRDGVNNPTAFRLIGNVKGKSVLDLACGEGYNTRILARKGAKVTGIDCSEKLTGLARMEERREPLGIRYRSIESLLRQFLAFWGKVITEASQLTDKDRLLEVFSCLK